MGGAAQQSQPWVRRSALLYTMPVRLDCLTGQDYEGTEAFRNSRPVPRLTRGPTVTRLPSPQPTLTPGATSLTIHLLSTASSAGSAEASTLQPPSVGMPRAARSDR